MDPLAVLVGLWMLYIVVSLVQRARLNRQRRRPIEPPRQGPIEPRAPPRPAERRPGRRVPAPLPEPEEVRQWREQEARRRPKPQAEVPRPAPIALWRRLSRPGTLREVIVAAEILGRPGGRGAGRRWPRG